MILADKIINERKKNGWSQEELAEKLGVSRQSVSKWEGAQAIPDLQKILKLSELFGVSTDFLLKDDIEGEYVEEQKGDGVSTQRKVTLEEACAYLDMVKETSPKIALGVALCILAPAALLFFFSLTYTQFVSDNVGVSVGLLGLFACIAAGVYLFIAYGSRKEYDHIEKGDFVSGYGVEGMVKERRSKCAGYSTKLTAFAILMCVFSPVPLVVNAVIDSSDFVICAMVALLLLIIAVAVYILVLVGSELESYRKLLKEEED